MTRTQKLSRALACSDGGCIFGHPGGMHTNGGCHCLVLRGVKPLDRVEMRKAILKFRVVLNTLDVLDMFPCDSCKEVTDVETYDNNGKTETLCWECAR